jgi:hypothetical protein
MSLGYRPRRKVVGVGSRAQIPPALAKYKQSREGGEPRALIAVTL